MVTPAAGAVVFVSVHIVSIFIPTTVVSRVPCMWTGRIGARNFGLIRMCPWRETMVSAGKSYVKSSEPQEKIGRDYEMNGMPSAGGTLTLSRIVNVLVTDDTLTVDREDGRTLSVPIGWFPRLAYGTPGERGHFQISGAGYGIYWPDLDEDIGIEGLLLGKNPRRVPPPWNAGCKRERKIHEEVSIGQSPTRKQERSLGTGSTWKIL